MVRNDWIILIAVGLVVLVGGVVLIATQGGDGSGGGGGGGAHGTAAPTSTSDGLIYPFATGANTTGGSATVIAISTKNQATGFNASTGIDWKTKRVGYDETEPGDIVCIRAPCDPLYGPQYHHKAPAGPRFGQTGYNATSMTIYAFNSDGKLQASNVGAGPFTKASFYQKIDSGVWYLGKGKVPDGMQPPPKEAKAFIDQARSKLVGLPPGGVATTSAKVDFVGTVYVTVRLDQIVYAP